MMLWFYLFCLIQFGWWLKLVAFIWFATLLPASKQEQKWAKPKPENWPPNTTSKRNKQALSLDPRTVLPRMHCWTYWVTYLKNRVLEPRWIILFNSGWVAACLTQKQRRPHGIVPILVFNYHIHACMGRPIRERRSYWGAWSSIQRPCRKT